MKERKRIKFNNSVSMEIVIGMLSIIKRKEHHRIAIHFKHFNNSTKIVAHFVKSRAVLTKGKKIRSNNKSKP